MHYESIDLKKHKKIRDDFDTRESVDRILIDDSIDKILKLLSEREAFVLRLRLFEDMTLDAIGKIVGVGRERIRQIYAKAERKLRSSERVEIVLWYLDNERLEEYREERAREAKEEVERQRQSHEEWLEKRKAERERWFNNRPRVESVLVEVKPIDPQEECVYNWVRQMAMPYFQRE